MLASHAMVPFKIIFKHKSNSKHFPFYLGLGLGLGLGLVLGLRSNHLLARNRYISLHATTQVAYFFIYTFFASTITLTKTGEYYIVLIL